MKQTEIQIGDKLWTILKIGTIKSGYDVQILRYKVGWKGTHSFIPTSFEHLTRQVINYQDCYKSLREVKKIVKSYFDGPVTFEEIDKDSYNVYGNHKTSTLDALCNKECRTWEL